MLPYDNNSTNCTYEPMQFLALKFALVGVFGTGVAIVGMFLNGLALVVLRRFIFHHSTHSPLIYLLMLAILDWMFMGIYILAISVQIFFDYYEDLRLYEMWNVYISYVMTIGKINQTASTYLLVAATVERMVDVGGLVFNVELKNSHRSAVIAGVILFATVFRIACFWELNTVDMTACSGFASISLEQHHISLSQSYQIYNFYVVNIVQVYMPFLLLLVCNIVIVRNVRKAIRRKDSAFRRESAWRCANERRNLRTATNILITVVTIYLVANVPNLVITFMEYIDRSFLQSHSNFYTLSVDFIGLTQVSASACRLLVCILWSERLRDILLNTFGIGNLSQNMETGTTACQTEIE